ncbi:MAG: hypothetical protein ACRENE_07635 [Polyangiaceae bacterium]
MRALVLLVLGVAPCAVSTGCRLGGPSGDPKAYVAAGDASSSNGGSDATVIGEDAAGSEDGGSAFDSLEDAGVDAVATGDGGSPDGGAVEGGDDASCTGTVPVCDPVHDTGCAGFQQCDVDPSQPNAPAGLCLFHSAPSDDSGACLQTIVSETCDARATCVAGACRTLCFCNADCPAGQCCGDTSGPKGFRLCAACP